MGDYGVGIQSYVRALSPVDFNQFVNNQSLFSPENSPRTMQDEILLEKSAAKQQQLSPSQNLNHISEQTDESVIRNGKSSMSPGLLEDKKIENNLVSAALQLEANTNLITSLASASHSFWTPPQGSTEDTFIQGTFQNMNGAVTLQQYPTAQPVLNAGLATHLSGISMPQQANIQRRAITAQHNFPQRVTQQGMLMNNDKNYPPWSSAHQQTQSSLSPWAQVQQQRRSVPNMSGFPVAPMKKSSFPHTQPHLNTSLSMLPPSKFRRSTSFPGQMHQAGFPKPSVDFIGIDESQRDNMLTYQDRSNSYDTMKFTNFENQLLDIMRSTTSMAIDPAEQIKGKGPFMYEDESANALSEDGSLDQTVPSLGSPSHSSPSSQPGLEHIERFSRKVFVGGLPPDIDEEEITAAFRRFGPLVVDWPHKAESKSYFPPKGYCFLLFQDEVSVQALIESCILDDDKLYWCVSSPTMKDKPVQIRPWNLSDSDFVMDGSQPLDPRKTIFVGGVPRPLRAVELAMIMDRLYGRVCYAGIDTDPELKYPKGAGRVAFSNQQSYIAAISARFVQLQHGEIDKRVEVKPYVLDDQMCDECQGARCGGKFAPFFCANVTCLQYYCEHCWAQIHTRPGREFHKPLVKEGADRPRAVPFRWC